jgi:PPOX class probable F420-dependent enzyme
LVAVPYHEMSPVEIRAFLQHGTRTAQLATTMADGAPHVMPVWFVLDGEDIVFNTGAATAKGRNLRRDPRVSLAVDDPVAPYGFVHIRGRAALSEELAEVRRFAALIGGRYMGAKRAEEFGERNGVAGELLVRVRPERLIAAADLAG